MTRQFAPLIRLTLLAASLALFTLAGCGVDSAQDTSGGTTGETATIIVRVDFTGASNLLTPSLTEALSVADVQSVVVNVFNPPPVVEQTVFLSPDPVTEGVWSGVLADLPVGPTLTFVTQAFDGPDGTGVELFKGVVEDVVLTGSEDPTTPSESISISVTPSGNEFPIINSVTINGCALPIEQCLIPQGGTPTILVDVSGLPLDTLAVDFPISNPTGAFNLSTEVFFLDGFGLPAGTPDFTYSAPTAIGASADSRTQQVRVTNGKGLSVTQSFILTIVNDTGIGLNFAPTVTGLSGSRAPGTGDVTWTATVSDDRDDPATLGYAWSFAQTAGGTPDASFNPGGGGVPDQNPGLMVFYTVTTVGTLTLTVTDHGTDGIGGNSSDDLSTTITFDMAAGQFPDIAPVGL